MPLLQDMVQQLDRELDRLDQIRITVTGLSRTPAVIRRFTEPAPVSTEQPAPKASPRTPRKAVRPAGQPRATRTRKPAPDTRALAVTVPSGPVVFYPERQSAHSPEHAVAEPELPNVPEHTPGAARGREPRAGCPMGGTVSRN